MKVLVCGYGRAGKRHAKALAERGLTVDIYDSHLPGVSTVSSSLPGGYDYCVIATPPSQHLPQIRSCMVYDVPVLVEKPLCGFFEGFADVLHYDKASICFNYRYHPAVLALKDNPKKEGEWVFYSKQCRGELPQWGLLLDHLGHTLDILLFLSGELFEPRSVFSLGNHLVLTGKVGRDSVEITDIVTDDPIEKLAFINCPLGFTDVEPDTTMFDRMYDEFLAGNYTGLNDAGRIQDALNQSKLVLNRRVMAA